MKRIISIILLSVILLAPILKAQDIPVVTPMNATWSMTPEREINWIGESINVVVNGSANTTITLELRPWNNLSMAFDNATFSDVKTTNETGGAIFNISTEKTEQWGEYNLVLVINQIIICQRNITISYDPIRWIEILVARNDAHDAQQDSAIQTGIMRDAAITKKLGRVWNLMIVVLFAFIVYVLITIELHLNYHIYKRKKAGKRPSRLIWLLQDYNSEFFHQAGGIIYDKPPVLPKSVNGEDLQWTGMVGKTTKEMIVEVDERMKHRKTVVSKMGPMTDKSRRKRKEERAGIKRKTEEVVEPVDAAVPTYADLYTDEELEIPDGD